MAENHPKLKDAAQVNRKIAREFMETETARGVADKTWNDTLKAVGKENVHVERKHGLHKASVIDFHSLRTTWITVALSRGVPIETVKLISGHKTVDIVTTHYFHPDSDQVRAALQVALPKALTGGTASAEERTIEDVLSEAKELLELTTGKKREETVAKAIGLIAEAQGMLSAGQRSERL